MTTVHHIAINVPHKDIYTVVDNLTNSGGKVLTSTNNRVVIQFANIQIVLVQDSVYRNHVAIVKDSYTSNEIDRAISHGDGSLTLNAYSRGLEIEYLIRKPDYERE